MKARRILLGVFILLAGVVAFAYFCLPPRARLPRLESQFHAQLERLHEIAYDTKGRWNTSLETCEADRKLFNQPAILRASVEPQPNCHLIVGDRTFVWSTELYLPAWNRSGFSLSRHWYLTSNGIVSAVMYRAQVPDNSGNPIGVTLVADINKLKQ